MSEQINNFTRLRGTTPPLGGSPIEPGIAVTVSANAPGAIVGSPVLVCASDGTGPNPVIILSAAVTAPDTALCSLPPSLNAHLSQRLTTSQFFLFRVEC
jgi:hypothetical protein